MIRSIWSHGENLNELLAVDLFECASIKAAHDHTMVLFSRANMVVLVRNAGPTIVPDNSVAREIDLLLVAKS